MITPSRPLQLVVAVLIVAVAWSFIFDVSVTPSAGFLKAINKLTPTSASPEDVVNQLTKVVLPEEGYSVPIKWGDTGIKLVNAGGIDLEKYRQNYADPQYEELLSYLTESKNEGITMNQENAYFWVNTLWALGLTQKSDVLDKGVMGTQYKDEIGNFASTGGWTLGTKDAVSLYSSAQIVKLTDKQQELVARAAENIYRPCCGNSTAFPDCNHGMAILGLLEIMASQGFSEQEMYQASLAFNSFWFTQTYMDLAYYFQTKENTAWTNVDPKKVLGQAYSSGQGYADIKQKIGNIPGLPSGGGSCGA